MDASERHAVIRQPGEGLSISSPISMLWRVTGAETGGAFSLNEGSIPPGVVVPPHRHRDADESFYILDGEATFRAGEQPVVVTAGAFIFIPRGTVRSIAVSNAAPLRLLSMYLPAGPERCYVEIAAMRRATPPPDAAAIRATFERYGWEWVEE